MVRIRSERLEVELVKHPRYARTVALAAPNDRERSQWYLQRYVAHLPAAGEMVLFAARTARCRTASGMSSRTTDQARRPRLAVCPELPPVRLTV